jgi:hypothetical protein
MPTKYDELYARTFNEIREMTLVGRAPNKTGAPLATGADALGGHGSKRDPFLDLQHARQDVQRQGMTQNYRAAKCEEETRANNTLDLDNTPRLDTLLSLQGNPYALKGMRDL